MGDPSYQSMAAISVSHKYKIFDSVKLFGSVIFFAFQGLFGSPNILSTVIKDIIDWT